MRDDFTLQRRLSLAEPIPRMTIACEQQKSKVLYPSITNGGYLYLIKHIALDPVTVVKT